MFSWFHADGLTVLAAPGVTRPISGTIGGAMNRAAGATGGGAPAGDQANQENRYTVGLDARWRIGAFGLDPTIAYQWGKYDTQAQKTNGTVGKVEGDAAAWLFDVIASYQLGPLLLEMRGMYTPGNKARDNLSDEQAILRAARPDTGTGRRLARHPRPRRRLLQRRRRRQPGHGYRHRLRPLRSRSGGIPGNVQHHAGLERVRSRLSGVDGARRSTRTPDACATAVAGAARNAGCAGRVTVAGARASSRVIPSYIGTEINGGFTWRFAPNTAFDLAAYYLFAGSALDTTENLTGVITKRDASDGYYAAARVRLSF